MSFPEHPAGIEESRRAYAPYNFVPLPERVVTLSLEDMPEHNIYSADRYSGFLNCELTSETPIYVRAGRSPEEARDAEHPEFFYIFQEDQPVIPGSTLRGMLRNLLEIVSYSKIAYVTEQNLVYRAVGDVTSHGLRYRDRFMQDDGNKYYTPLIQGGYIKKKENGEWGIQPAQVIDGTSYAYIPLSKLNIVPCETKKTIYIQTGPYQYHPVRGGFIHVKYARVTQAFSEERSGFRESTLSCSGPMSSKRTEIVVYEPDKNAEILSLDDDKIKDYKDQLEKCKEQQNLFEDQKKDGVLQNGYPVLYLLDKVDKGKVDFFGHCRMFRLPYHQSPMDFVPGELRAPHDIDLAEAIFGYAKDDKTIPEGKKKAYAGRIFVSDASLQPGQDSLWLSPQKIVTPKILNSPKPTCFQHYLVQKTPNFIKAGKRRDGKPKYEIRLFDYEARTPGETVIRGLKSYWHKGEVSLEDIKLEKTPKGEVDTKIQPLRSGLTFKFRIDFENFSKIELGALLWILNVASDEKYRLKVGMGKPLGMGAVKITSALNLIDRQKRYQKLFQDGEWNQGICEQKLLIEESKSEFERFILDRLGNKSAQRLSELKRIQAFLTLLSWPGPEKEQTRYMEISREDAAKKRGKFNEYRGRPVLPLPFEVFPIKGYGQKEQDESRKGNIPEGYLLGKVKDFGLGPNKSFGYILYWDEKDGNDKEIFVHKSRLGKGLSTLIKGQNVIFREGHGMKGRQAIDVQPSPEDE